MESKEILHNIEEKPKVGVLGESNFNGASYLYQVVLQDHNYSNYGVSGNCSAEGSSVPFCKQESLDSADEDHGRCPLPNNSPVLSPRTPLTLPNHQQQQHPRTGRSNGLKVLPPASPGSKMPPTSNGPRRKRSESGSSPMAMTLKAVETSTASVQHTFSGLDALSAAARLKPSYDAHQAALKENRTSDVEYSCKTVSGASANANGTASPMAGAAGPMASFFSGWGGWWKDNRPRQLWNSPGEEHEGVITRPKYNPEDGDSLVDSDSDRFPSDKEGEETETAPECEGEDDRQEESITRCICDFGHDDGYMICCDRCSVWQHVDCMGIDRSNIPEEYLCELCQPRRVDKARARGVQYRKRQEFRLATPPVIKDSLRDRPTYLHEDLREDKPRKNSWSGRGSRGRGGTSKATARDTLHMNNNKESKPRRGPKLGRKRSRKEDPDSEDASTKTPNPGSVRRRKLWREKQQLLEQQEQQQQLEVSQDSSITLPRTPDPRDLVSPVDTPTVHHPPSLEWIEDYEEAVTNHYSPELRARVGALKPNGILGSENGAHVAPVALVVPDSPVHDLVVNGQGWKTLTANRRLEPGQIILECRGKLMLPSQLRPSSLSLNASTALPHVIFCSTGAGEGHLEVCLDGRSYGNEARFLRQSCVSNAEIKHSLGKGLIHLYLVVKTAIAEKEEIVVPHEDKNWMLCEHKKCPGQRTSPRSGRISITEEPKKRRRRTSSATGTTDILSSPQRRAQRSISKVSVDSGHEGTDLVSPGTHSNVFVTDHDEQGDGHCDEQKKAAKTREERKMEAIMKAFERMEKQAQRKQEAMARTHRRDSQSSPKKHEDGDEADEETEKKFDMGERRERLPSLEHKDKGKFAKRGCGRRRGRMRRSSAVLSMGERSRTSSGDMQSPTLDEEPDLNGPFPNSNATTPIDESDKGDMISFKCPKTKKLMASTWPKDQVPGSNGDTLGSPTIPQDGGLAVPLCYMRSPKSPTRSGQRPFPVRHSSGPSGIPALALVRSGPASPDTPTPALPVSLAPGDGPGSDEGSNVNPEVRFAKKRWLRQAISEETEVAAEHSHSHGGTGAPVAPVGQPSGPITQESFSLGAGSQDLEHVTPLKKRRLARASMSSEASFTPPSTPTPGITPTLEDGASENLQKSVLRSNLDKVKAEMKLQEREFELPETAAESENQKEESLPEVVPVTDVFNEPNISPDLPPTTEELPVVEKEEPPRSPEELEGPPPPLSFESEVDDLTKDDPFFRPDRAVFANPEAPDVLEQFTNPSRPSPSPPPLPPVEANPNQSLAIAPSSILLAATTLPAETEFNFGQVAKLGYNQFGSEAGNALMLPNGGFTLAGYAAPPPLLPETMGFAPTVVGLILPPVCPPSLWPPEVNESPVVEFVNKPAWDFRTSRTQLTKHSEPVEPEPSPLIEDTPKPAKKKLSILEYRKRKLTSDDLGRDESESHQKLSKNDSSEDHFCTEDYLHDGTNPGEGLPVENSITTEETSTSDTA